MHWRIVCLAVLSIAAGQAEAQAEDASHPCSLLTAAQISAALGSVGQSAEGNMPGKAGMKACSYGLPGGGLFTLTVGKVPNASMNTRQLLDYMNAMYDMLKGQGWTYEKKDFGGTSCSMVTPPAGAANASPATTCASVANGMLVIAGASSKTSVPAEKVKSLVETAAKRLQ